MARSMTARCSSPSTRRNEPQSPRRLRDDDSVVVAVGDFAWHKSDSTELDVDVAFTGAGLGALARVGAQRLDPDVDAAQRGRIANGAVDDDARPAAALTQPGDHIADQ